MMNTLTIRAATAVLVALAALMILTGSAFATAFTSKGSVYEGVIEASGGVSFSNTSCENSTLKGEAESNTNYVTVELSQWSFTECSGGMTVTVALPTFLKIAPTAFPWVSAVGMEEVRITFTSHLTGKSCTFRPAGVSTRFYPSTEGTASIEVIQLLKFVEGTGFCAEDMMWEGIYTVNTPDELKIH